MCAARSFRLVLLGLSILFLQVESVQIFFSKDHINSSSCGFFHFVGSSLFITTFVGRHSALDDAIEIVSMVVDEATKSRMASEFAGMVH